MTNRRINNKSVCFRHWTRKKFSILISLRRVVKIGVLCLAYSLVNKPSVYAQPQDSLMLNSKEIPEAEITGRRSQVVSSEITRLVSVISRDEIEKAGIQNLADLIEYASNVDIRQRGSYGVQADASIRGSSFDHVMVLVNGIVLSDPQTGHFNLDIPIDFETVERIEVLEGPAARVLGPGAFMGAINIITRVAGKNQVGASQTFGQYGFLRSNLNGGIARGPFSNTFSASRTSSDGYIKNTDFSLYNLYYRMRYDRDHTSADFQTGYQTKKFGAAGFYSPRFPDQYEETGTWFGSLKVITGNAVKISPVIYWRQKDDHFMLIRHNPAPRDNYHLTNVYGSQLNFTAEFHKVVATLGFDLKSEGLFSNHMGYLYGNPRRVKGTDSVYYTHQYSRTDFATFVEFIYHLKQLTVTGGTMVNWNSGFKQGAAFYPGLDLSYRYKKSNLYVSINRALHLPTFTDLFYTDPLNQGNIALKPNELISYEGGASLKGKSADFRISGFYNNGHDIIDWLWSYKTSKFSPVNVSHYVSKGFTVNLNYDLNAVWLSSLSVNYLFLNTHKSVNDSVSKYNNLKNKLSVLLTQQLNDHFQMTWSISYQDRGGESINYNEQQSSFYAVSYKPYWLVDWAFKWQFSRAGLFAEITNLMNTHYTDAGFIQQPGRWFKAGIIFSTAK